MDINHLSGMNAATEGSTRMATDSPLMEQLRSEAAAQSEADLAEARATIQSLRSQLATANTTIGDLQGASRAAAKFRDAAWRTAKQIAEDATALAGTLQR